MTGLWQLGYVRGLLKEQWFLTAPGVMAKPLLMTGTGRGKPGRGKQDCLPFLSSVLAPLLPVLTALAAAASTAAVVAIGSAWL